MRVKKKCKHPKCDKEFIAIPAYKLYCSGRCRMDLNRNKSHYAQRARMKANSALLMRLVFIGGEVKMAVLSELAKQVCFNKEDFIRRLLDAGFSRETAEREWADYGDEGQSKGDGGEATIPVPPPVVGPLQNGAGPQSP